MVGMHWLQWMQSESVAAPDRMRLSRSGSRSSARAMATNGEALVDGRLHGVEAVDAAEQDERQVERLAELAGVGQEVGLLERVLAHEPLADQLEAGAHQRRQGGGHLGPRARRRGTGTSGWPASCRR